MAYTKHQWLTGEIITAEKLDHIECGLECTANCSCIWHNESPEASFAAQSISLDTTPFDRFIFYFITEDEGAWQTICISVNKSHIYVKDGAWHIPVKYGNYERFVTVTDAAVAFSDCKYGVSYNGRLIPYSIHAFPIE